MIVSAVTTCRRPNGVRYLRDTLVSIHEAGFGRPFIVEDGDQDDALCCRIGIVPKFKMALREALQSAWNVDASHVVVFQDDIRLASGLREYLETGTLAQSGIFSLYLSPQRTAPVGWSELEDDGNYPTHVGACGFVIDTETALKIVNDPPFPRVDRLGPQLVLWCRRNNIPFWVHSPSLITHIGEVSVRGITQVVGNPAELEAPLAYS